MAAYFVIYLLTQLIPIFNPVAMVFPGMGFWAVSYTHLDVYKRQVQVFDRQYNSEVPRRFV